uniref:Putative secreted protein n=1 Tax=Anopheles darlingi TaxID=43151 RepID=A0A2M4DMV3_ANODA
MVSERRASRLSGGVVLVAFVFLAPPLADSSVCERLRNDLRLADLSFVGDSSVVPFPVGLDAPAAGAPVTGLNPLTSFGRVATSGRPECDSFNVEVRLRSVPRLGGGGLIFVASKWVPAP